MGELGQAEILQRASEGLGDTDVFQIPLPDSYAGHKCSGPGRLEKGVSGSFYGFSSILLFCLCCEIVFETTRTATGLGPYSRPREQAWAGGSLRSLERAEEDGLKFSSSDGCRNCSRS